MIGRRFACPLCETAVGTPTELRRHLVVGHRKCALAVELVASTGQSVDSPEPT